MEENKGSGKAILFDGSMNGVKSFFARALFSTLKRMNGVSVVVLDGVTTIYVIRFAKDACVKVLSAGNFATKDTNIRLLWF